MSELIGYLSEAEHLDGMLSEQNQLEGELSLPEVVNGGLSEEVKQALLDLFQHLAYTDADGQDYYDALYNALYPPAELVRITAVYTQTSTVYPDTPLDDLKDDLVVTAHYSDGTSEAVTTYTLSGTLTAGTSVVTVTYEDKTTTFTVTVSAPAVLSSISAVYTQSGTVYPTDSLDSLKPDLVVTAHYSDSSTATVTTYTLSGTLTVGTSTITVTYSGKTTTFNVTVSEAVVLDSITAVYTQSGTVYDTDSLDSLKTDLVVTATYSDSSTATVPSADYTLSGTLTVGTSTVTVSYEGKSTTFTVTVTASNPYVSDGLIMWLDGIKNGTNGAHESTLTTWVDQTGNGWDWTNSGATVGDKSVIFSKSGTTFLYRSYQSVPANAAMIEIVAKKTTGGCILTGFGRNKVGNMNIPSTGNNLVFHTSAGSGADKNTAFDFGTTGQIHSANSAGYLDGQAIQSFASSAADWQYEYPTIGLYRGSAGTGREYKFNGEIYCIRLYNRVLTQQEILANYAADVARFGIGGA